MTGGARRVGVAIPAAGGGRRMGGLKKAFLELGGEPLLRHAILPFLAYPGIIEVVIALPPEEAEDLPPWLRDLDPRLRVTRGGESRADSVRAALEALPDEVEVVLVHDAARPFVTTEIIERCIEAVSDREGAVAGWPSTDSLKEVAPDRRILASPDRSRIWRAQTPQAFPRAALLAAYRRASGEASAPTDDAEVFLRAGGTVRMVEGAAWNLKVTHPDDLAVAECLLSRSGRPSEVSAAHVSAGSSSMGLSRGFGGAVRHSADPTDDAGIARTAEHLAAGGLLAYPTETVYGLGGLVRTDVIERLRALKGREAQSPFLVLAPSAEAIELEWTPDAGMLAGAFWPGPLTLVLGDPGGRFPAGVRGPRGGVAVRVSPHPFVRALTRALGEPILSTSANLRGQQPAATVDGLARALAGRPGVERLWLADGGRLVATTPSSLVDCTSDPPLLLREGAVSRDRLLRVVPGLQDSP